MKKLKLNKAGIKVKVIAAVWGGVFVIALTMLVVAQVIYNETGKYLIEVPAYYTVNLILVFASFVMTTLFSFVIINHNAIMRDMSHTQFVSSNYSVIDFVDFMIIYPEYERYVERLKKTNDFTFYMRNNDTKLEEIEKNFSDFMFLTLKISFKIMEGKNIATVRIKKFLFGKENGEEFNFVPCAEDNRALMMYNEEDKKQVISMNLIEKIGSEFFAPNVINTFSRIRVELSMISLLGVAVNGWIELYFTNPEKRSRDGASVYKINSSRFRVNGLPQIIN